MVRDQFFTLWHRARDGDRSPTVLAVRIEPVRRGVRRSLEAGAKCGQKRTQRVCANILKLERSLWTFVRVAGVEPTNNAAERALRRAVLWRRTSFGTDGQAGSRFVERILTVVTTLRQQGHDVLEYLTQVCAGTEQKGGNTPTMLSQPRLLPVKA
jgi:transposase